MLVFDSTGKLVDLQGDQWNSGNLPLGYYATPYQLAQATGIQTGVGGIENRAPTVADPFNPAGGFTSTYDTVSAPDGSMGYSWDYAQGRPAGHAQQPALYFNPNWTDTGGSPYSSVQGGAFTQAMTLPAPNSPTQYGAFASLVDPVMATATSLPPAGTQNSLASFGSPRAMGMSQPEGAPSVSPYFDPTHRQVGQDPEGNPIYQLVDEAGMIKQWTLKDNQIVGLQDVGRAGPQGGAAAPTPATLASPVVGAPAPQASASPSPLAGALPTAQAGGLSSLFGGLFGGDSKNAAGVLPGLAAGSGGGGGTATTSASTPNSLQGEGAATLQALVALQPQMFGAYQQYAPQYANVDLQTLKTTLFGQFDPQAFDNANPGFLQSYRDLQAQGEIQGWTPEQFAAAYIGKAANDPSLLNFYNGGQMQFNQRLTDEANKQTISANTALRQGNVNDAANLGGQALSTMQALNPNLYGALGGINSFVNPAVQLYNLEGQPMERIAAGQTIPSGRWTSAQGGAQWRAGGADQGGTVAQGTPGGIGVSAFQTSLGNTFNQGPSYQSVASASNPLLGTVNQQARSLGATSLGSDLSDMARKQLALGGSLSDEQKRNATQAAREAYGARGLINSNSAVAQEILNRDAYSQQLLGQRQGFAQNVNQLEQAQQGLNNNFLLSATGANAAQGAQDLQASLANQGANLQAQQMNQSLGTTLAGLDYSRQQQNFGNLVTNAQLQSANAFNPFATITSAGAANQGTNTSLFGQGAATSSGATANQGVMNMFNPFNAYASDYYNTQKNAQYASQISAGNNKAALQGAGIGAIGQVGGAAITAKMFLLCVPEGELVDTPEGQRAINSIRAGDIVIGYTGKPAVVLQKHEYAENPNAVRFLRFTLDNGRQFAVCDMHRVQGVRSKDLDKGDSLNGATILDIERFDGVTRSYDLMTDGAGYRMSGVPVNSMIAELALLTKEAA